GRSSSLARGQGGAGKHDLSYPHPLYCPLYGSVRRKKVRKSASEKRPSHAGGIGRIIPQPAQRGVPLMNIKFSCPKCDRVLAASDDKAGRPFRCPTCGQTMTVPGAARAGSGRSAADDDDDPEEVRMKACPFCDEKVRADA